MLSAGMSSALIFISFAFSIDATSIHGHNLHGGIIARQDDTITPVVQCALSDAPVQACTASDLTSVNWAKFNIDNFLVEYLMNFGVSTNFPSTFYLNQIPPTTPSRLDCSNMDAQGCLMPSVENPAARSDCAFTTVVETPPTACQLFLSPQAGFVVQNYINLWTGVVNNFRAIDVAGRNILDSTFVDDVVEGLKERKGNVVLAIIEAIAGIAVGFLPFGSAFILGVRMISIIDRILVLGGGNSIKTSGFDVIKIAERNDAIDDQAEQVKDQMKRQIENIIVGTQQQMQSTLDIVFGSAGGSTAIRSVEEARNSLPFQVASSGVFLDGVPSQEELVVNMERNLGHWVVSSTIRAMEWHGVLDNIDLLDDPANPGGVCEEGFGGTTGVAGAECAYFTRGNGRAGPDDPIANGLSRIRAQVDLEAAFFNAEGCQALGGGDVDWAAVVEQRDPGDEQGLPRCLYNFKVSREG